MNEKLEVRITGKNDMTPALRAARAEVRQFSSDVSADVASGMRRVAAEVLSIQAAVSGFRNTVLKGFDFNAQLETSRLGLASLVTSFAQLKDAQGRVLEGTEKFNAAQQIAVKMQNQLKVAALQTTASYSDLLRALQEGFGPAAQAMFNPDQIVEFSKTMAQAAGAMGIHISELGQEIRGVLEVDLTRHSRIARALLGSTGMSADDLRKKFAELAKEGKLFDFLKEKLSGFAAAGDHMQNTFSGALSNLKDAFEQAMGAGTQGVLGDMTKAVQDLTAEIITFDAQGQATFNDDLVAGIDKVASAFLRLAQRGAEAAKDLTKEGGLIDTLLMWRELNRRNIAEPVERAVAEGPSGFLEGFRKSSGSGFMETKYLDSKAKTESYLAKWFAERFEQRQESLATSLPIDARGHFAARKPEVYGPAAPTPEMLAAMSLGQQEREKALKEAERLQKKIASETARQMETYREMGPELRRQTEDFRLQALSAGATTELEKERLELMREQLAIDAKLAEEEKKIAELKHLSVEKRSELEQDAIKRWAKERDAAEAKSNEKRTAFLTAFTARQKAATTEWLNDLTDKSRKTYEENAARFFHALSQASGRYQEEFRSKFVEPMSDAFMDGLVTGGKNVGEIISSAFLSSVRENLDKAFDGLDDLIAKAFSLTPGTYEKDGKWYVAGNDTPFGSQGEADIVAQKQGGARGRQYLAGGVAIAGAGYNAYQTQRAGQGNLAMSTLSGAAAGMTFGWVGAIVGAVVGLIGGISGQRSEQNNRQFIEFDVNEEGNAYSSGRQNVDSREAERMLAAFQDTIDTFWNGYVGILMKFPAAVIPQMGAISGQFLTGTTNNLMRHFDHFLNTDLPQNISTEFLSSLKDAFSQVGMEAERFDEIWQRISRLDPKKAMGLVSELADAMIQFDKALAFFAGSDKYRRTAIDGMPQNSVQAAWAELERERGLSVGDSIRQSDEDLIRFASHLQDLTGEAQIRAAKELSDLLTQRMEKEKAAILQLIDLADNVAKSFDALKRNFELMGLKKEDGTPDLQGQAQYLRDYANQILAQMAGATSAEELQYLQGEFLSTIQQIASVSGQIGPEAAEAARQWALEALEIGRQEMLSRIQELGDMIDQANQDFLEQFQPFYDRFTQALGDAGDDIDRDLREPIGRARDELDLFGASTAKAAEAIERLASAAESMAADGQEVVVTIQDPSGYVSSVTRRRVLAGAA